MIKSENINFNRVEEMAEGDMEFRAELLQAIYTSILDLKTKYVEGISLHSEEILQQARHKIKPTVSLFELKRLNAILQEGKTLVSLNGFKEMDNHQNQFIKAAEELLKDLEEIIP
jgi:hypothetical protein